MIRNYSISVGSFSSHSLDVTSEILACPTIAEILFPAILPVSPDTDVQLASYEDFDLSLVPEAFYVEHLFGFALRGNNDIELSFTLCLKDRLVAPDVVVLEFTNQHLEHSIITYQDIKSLFDEIIPVFKVDTANVHERMNARRRGRRWIETPDHRDYALRINWFNYFGAELVELMGRERFSRLSNCEEVYELHGGMMVILQEEPFDDSNPEHRERQMQAETELELEELIGEP